LSECGCGCGGETGTGAGRFEVCGEELGCAVPLADLRQDGFGVLLLLLGVGVVDGDVRALRRECQGRWRARFLGARRSPGPDGR